MEGIEHLITKTIILMLKTSYPHPKELSWRRNHVSQTEGQAPLLADPHAFRVCAFATHAERNTSAEHVASSLINPNDSKTNNAM